ncbi:MAG: FAD-dependent monooxygenase [Acidobacteriota bacterium]|nr:FAD-dependent monooxygenase [Acidobacteriota bacterium]
MRTDVIIVGAGPTGLALAAQFIRYGVDFVILDKKQATTPYSKAIGVQARTLEIYEQIDLAQSLIAEGAIAQKARLIVGGETRGEIEFGEIGAGLSPYPFVLLVEQGRHEKILYDFIKSRGADVRWQTELESFSQDETGGGGVTAKVKTAGGETGIIEAKYLVGCDGAKSPVRHSLGLTFEGSTMERMFYVADVEIDWHLAHDALQIFLMKNNLLAFFPMVGSDRHFRIVGTFPEEFAKDEGEVLYEEIEEQIKKDAELNLDITKVNWFSTYKVHTRHVNKFFSGGCFLAGDAAHIHTPAGAQGMNTGIQDGYNLAWKLALVLRGRASEKILETYNQERLENAENLLKTTDRFFNLVASPDAFLAYFRTHVFPYIAGAAFTLDAVKKFFFPRISQIGINYLSSPISETNGNFAVKAGERMPYFEIVGASIYERLREPKFHLLTFFDGVNAAPEMPAKFKDDYADSVDFHALPLYPKIAEIFGAAETFSLLLRPDNYIGMISARATPETIENYLKRILNPDIQD